MVTDVYLFKPLLPHVGHIEISKINDQSFEPFRIRRAYEGKSAKTIRLSLSAAQTVLNKAATEWRYSDTNMPYLDRAPSIALPDLAGQQRPPRPITWVEQDRLLAELPPHLKEMGLFILNSGLRDDPIVNLQWDWLIPVPEVGTHFFFVPREHVKGRKEDRILVLNSVAKRILDAQRGKHDKYVFVWRRERTTKLDEPPKMKYEPIGHMNNTAWQSARTRAGLDDLHVHDLRHTFATRLGAARVDERTISELLWHGKSTITRHYIGSQILELENIVERIAARPESEDIPIAALMLRMARMTK